ncbi:MAG: ExeA family protein [Acidobacteriaceae bacterium]
MAGYRQFYELSGPAFGKSLTHNALLVYPQLEELGEEIDELIVEGGIGIVTGEMGIGKTTSLRYCTEALHERNCHVAYHGSSRHAVAVLQGLVEALGVAPASLRVHLLRQLTQLVWRMWQEQRKRTVVILDDAHLLEDSFLEDARLLTNFGMDDADPLVLLLVGHPSLRMRLGRPVHLALLDRVRMHYRLEGLSCEETAQYVDRHLKHAGARREVFTPDAKAAIFEHSQGIPRRINQLAREVLKKGAQRKLTPVDAAFVSTIVPLLANN